jgi:hypothetical protein
MPGVALICNGASNIGIGPGLHIKSLKVETGKTAALSPGSSGTLVVEKDVELSGYLDAGSSPSVDIEVRGLTTPVTDSDWTQHGDYFIPRTGTVAFTNTDVTIDGVNTRWYNLSFTNTAGVTVKFRNYPNSDYDTAPLSGHHINGVFIMANGAASSLTRLDSPLPDPPGGLSYDEFSDTYADRFWNLFYDPGKSAVFDALEDTDIYWCWVRPAISKEMIIPRIGNWGTSYVITDQHNVGWSVPYLIYSFTEDWDHNGRIDHVRVQSGAPIDPDFSGFDADVEGYDVKGYRRITDTSDPYYDFLFFIELEEKDSPDTDKTPRVLNITGVKDSFGRPFNLPDSVRTPIDTAPPQIVYSLALPGGTEIFIRLSEPVGIDAGFNSALSINGTGGVSVTWVTLPSSQYPEFIITAQSPFTAEDIAGEKNFAFNPSSQGYFYDSPASGVTYPPPIGTTQIPDCYLLWPIREYRYGDTLGSSGYEDISLTWGTPGSGKAMPNYNWKNGSSLTPPYDYVHRLSDLLVAPPPAGDSDPFFALPVFAHDLSGAANTDLRTRIFEFDGSRELMDMEVTVQAKLSDAAWDAGITGLELRYGTDKRIPEEFRSKEALHGMEGLWLPDGNSSVEKTALVPRPYAAGNSGGVPAPGNRLYNFTIPGSNLVSYTNVEFYFTAKKGASGGLVIARFDAKGGASLPWYRRIKPFSFRLREMVSQRGGATILNNVINPDRGDSAVLHYVLTRGGRVTIQVFTLDGNLVKVLERSSKGAGEYAVPWDGRNNGGRTVARGLYFIRIVGPDIDEIRKVMVVK